MASRSNDFGNGAITCPPQRGGNGIADYIACGAQWRVCKVSVTRGRLRLAVSEQSANLHQTKTLPGSNSGVGVTQVVQAVGAVLGSLAAALFSFRGDTR